MNCLYLLCLLLLLTNTDGAIWRRKSLYRQFYTDMGLTMPTLVTRHEYPLETHKVTSSDGYIQVLHRIPRGKGHVEGNSPRIPVLLHHAFLCSSVDWIILGPDKALGYLLADAGYDVWLANSRGNTYSRGHISLSTSDPQYWEFSWHEIGAHDLPAAIDYILKTTAQEKLFYIGYSMGTTAFFVLMSEHPEYNDKVRAFIGLGPVATFFIRPDNKLLKMGEDVGEPTLQTIINVFGTHEIWPRKRWLSGLGLKVCYDGMITQMWCASVMEFICGKSTQTNLTMLPIFYSHTPAGASSGQLLHFAQLIDSGKFQQFDFGPEKNMDVYGYSEPPEYNLNNTKVPVALFHSESDTLATVENVMELSEVLPNVILRYQVPHESFNHLDFMWGKDVDTLVYSHVIDLLRQH